MKHYDVYISKCKDNYWENTLKEFLLANNITFNTSFRLIDSFTKNKPESKDMAICTLNKIKQCDIFVFNMNDTQNHYNLITELLYAYKLNKIIIGFGETSSGYLSSICSHLVESLDEVLDYIAYYCDN